MFILYKRCVHKMRVTKSEYLYDVVTGGSGAFDMKLVELNPGLECTFPYLASLAQSYDNYQFNSLSFVFKSKVGEFGTTTNNALGTVMMYFEPDWSATRVATKQEFLAKGNCVNGQTTDNIVLRCPPRSDLRSRFQIRVSGKVVGGTYDAHTSSMIDFDIGRVFLATQGCPIPNQNIGELWVSYDVTLMQEDLVAADKNYLVQYLARSLGTSVNGWNLLGSTIDSSNLYGPFYPIDTHSPWNSPIALCSTVSADTILSIGTLTGNYANGLYLALPNWDRTAYFAVSMSTLVAAAAVNPQIGLYCVATGSTVLTTPANFPYASALSIRITPGGTTPVPLPGTSSSIGAAGAGTIAQVTFIVRCQGDRTKATSLVMSCVAGDLQAVGDNNANVSVVEIPEELALSKLTSSSTISWASSAVIIF